MVLSFQFSALTKALFLTLNTSGEQQADGTPQRSALGREDGDRLWILSELLPFVCFSLLEVTSPISAALLVKLCCVTIRADLVPAELQCQVLQSTMMSVLGAGCRFN